MKRNTAIKLNKIFFTLTIPISPYLNLFIIKAMSDLLDYDELSHQKYADLQQSS